MIIYQQSSGRAVIFVIQSFSDKSWQRGLATAQKFAIKNNLPLAACFVFQSKTIEDLLLKSATEAEDLLAGLNIPLIFMVGNRSAAISAFCNSAMPIRVYSQTKLELPEFDVLKESNKPINLIEHPIIWPSQFMKLSGVLTVNGCIF